MLKQLVLKFIYFSLASSARRIVKKFDPFVIGITGSVGKSSTKDAVYQVMRDHFGAKNVAKTAASLNGEIGIPLTILGYSSSPNTFLWPLFLLMSTIKSFTLKEYPKYLVLEIGLEHVGDMAYFGTIIRPNVGIITSLSGAHLINFRGLKEYQEEKLAILQILRSPKYMIVNADDPNLANLENAQTIGITNSKADFVAESLKIDFTGNEYRIASTGQKIAVKSKVFGIHMIYPQLFAFAVGHFFKMRPLEVAKSLEKILPGKGRMNLIEGKKRTLIIDDTYNSNPTSLRAALDTLATISYSGRKVAIIGNMNELGEVETSSHQKLGAYARTRCDQAIFVGPNAKIMAKSFGDDALFFENRKQLIGELDSLVKPGDLILIKASQNKNFFEEVTKVLMKNPDQAAKLLVRQTKSWLKKK